MRSISICFLCQKGGEPASSVYMMTPELHLQWDEGNVFFFCHVHMSSCVVLVCTHSHVHRSPISFVSCIHGAFDDLWGEVTGGPTHLCGTDMSNFTEVERKTFNPLGEGLLEEDVWLKFLFMPMGFFWWNWALEYMDLTLFVGFNLLRGGQKWYQL